jgi:hypothetical protein
MQRCAKYLRVVCVGGNVLTIMAVEYLAPVGAVQYCTSGSLPRVKHTVLSALSHAVCMPYAA